MSEFLRVFIVLEILRGFARRFLSTIYKKISLFTLNFLNLDILWICLTSGTISSIN